MSGKNKTQSLAVVHRDCAGIDVGKRKHYVAVDAGRFEDPVRHFGTFTGNLEAMACWLASCGVRQVAMESTRSREAPVPNLSFVRNQESEWRRSRGPSIWRCGQGSAKSSTTPTSASSSGRGAGRTRPPVRFRLIHLLRRSGQFDSWPLEAIVPSRNAFFSFLQERWPLYLDRLAGNACNDTRDVSGSSGLDLEGPADLPFDHDDVRVYIDNLFVEGMLSAVSHEAGDALGGEWASVGIRIDPEADQSRRLGGLMEAVGDTIPGPDARHHEWTAFAYRWAELDVLRPETAASAQSETGARITELRMEVDLTFLAWTERRYAGLHNQPPDPPVMVHHVPRYLARRLEHVSNGKVALIVVDGLALDQWIVLRDVLAHQRPCLRFREGAVFAWVPTITSVSRQAIFAGKAPFYFPSSIQTTDREARLWKQFWVDAGVEARAIGFAKGLGDGPLDGVGETLSRTDIRALGLVVDEVDKIMHGMELGTAGMHNQVRQWAGEGFMAGLLDKLLGDGFAVYPTSDHGNIEAEGRGRPSEGAVADVRGERARIYPDEVLRSRVHEQFPDAVAWPAIGLPEDYVALLAPGRTAFVREGERVVGHGGASLEEVVVPWIRIERAAA